MKKKLYYLLNRIIFHIIKNNVLKIIMEEPRFFCKKENGGKDITPFQNKPTRPCGSKRRKERFLFCLIKDNGDLMCLPHNTSS